jgi:hypothetical protein
MENVPVVLTQLGWVTLPNIGVEGVLGALLTVRLTEGKELHPPDMVAITV